MSKHVRVSGSHVKEQVLRFARLFAAAFIAQLVAVDLHHLGRTALISTAVGAAEVVLRQAIPVAPIVDTVPAVVAPIPPVVP